MAADGASVATAEKLRDEGNVAFKAGDMAKAMEWYSLGLAAESEDRELKATLHRNRAMVRLRLADAAGSEADCTAGEWTDDCLAHDDGWGWPGGRRPTIVATPGGALISLVARGPRC
jgi:hypothetical protein